MPFFRKKPVVIEAVRFSGVVRGEVGMYNVLFDTTDPLPEWLWRALAEEVVFAVSAEDDFVYIKTMEGLMEAGVGDWIIKGVKGELYPCKADIFALTYDVVVPPRAADDEFRPVAI
jgi:hypothetical protein